MSRITKKFIKFGTGSTEVNAQVIPANFTPSNYTPTQVGSEGTDKISAHLKGVDIVLGGIAGVTGDIALTSFSLANNQSSAADVTGFAFANGTTRSFEALVSVHINATTSLFESFKILGIQRGADWQISIESAGDSSLVSFSITNAGQLQYTSGNYTGFSAGTIKFRAITTTV